MLSSPNTIPFYPTPSAFPTDANDNYLAKDEIKKKKKKNMSVKSKQDRQVDVLPVNIQRAGGDGSRLDV